MEIPKGFQKLTDSILPDGYTELIVHYQLIEGREEVENSDEISIFAGQLKTSFQLEMPTGLGMIGVRFRAEGASCLFRENLSNTASKIVPIEDIAKEKLSELEGRVLEGRTRLQRVHAVLNYLNKYINFDSKDEKISSIVNFIINKKGQVPLPLIVDHACLSQRQLERRFKSVVGLSMKEYSRIIRFKEAINWMDEFPKLSLADIALNSGYFDQAHFNKDFKVLTGLKPKDFLKKSGDLSSLYLPNENVDFLQ